MKFIYSKKFWVSSLIITCFVLFLFAIFNTPYQKCYRQLSECDSTCILSTNEDYVNIIEWLDNDYGSANITASCSSEVCKVRRACN